MAKVDKTSFEKRIEGNSHFADPDRIKYQRPKDKPKDGKNSPWDFRCPQSDQRSSNFVNAGTHDGVGIKQPIGHKGDPKPVVDVLPQWNHVTMRDDEEG